MEPGPDDDDAAVLELLKAAAAASRTAAFECELLSALQEVELELEGAEPEAKRACRRLRQACLVL